jgi:PilZ domain-containing protein
MVGRERRRDERKPLRAFVRCQARNETFMLPVVNASASGLFLAGEPGALRAFSVGTELELAVLPMDDLDAEPALLRGVIARTSYGSATEPAGFGIAITRGRDEARYAELLRKG